MQTRFYHASPRRFRVGDILHPYARRLGGDARMGVFVTLDPVPHYTIMGEAEVEGWHVYEVEPLGTLWYGSCWDELETEFARVLRYVGSARGIIARRLRTAQADSCMIGSRVLPSDVRALPGPVRGRRPWPVRRR